MCLLHIALGRQVTDGFLLCGQRLFLLLHLLVLIGQLVTQVVEQHGVVALLTTLPTGSKDETHSDHEDGRHNADDDSCSHFVTKIHIIVECDEPPGQVFWLRFKIIGCSDTLS